MSRSLTIRVADPTSLLVHFTVLEVLRGTTRGGPFFPITGPVSTPATIECAAGPYTVNGLVLSLAVDDGVQQDALLSSYDPISSDDLADELNDAVTGLAAYADGDTLILSSAEVGTDSKLETISSSALAALGISVTTTFGKAADITILSGTHDYTLVDELGESTDFYIARPKDDEGGVGKYVPAFDDDNLIVATSDLALLTVDLATANGQAAEGKKIAISLANPHEVHSINNIMVSNDPQVVIETDAFGHAETTVVKGITVDVHVAGSSIARRITVPNSDFDLGDAVAAVDDLFQIHVFDLPAAPHHS